jgi:transcriptional regulator with XRE-family HTH domain
MEKEMILKTLLKKKKITLRQMARDLDISESHLSRIVSKERGISVPVMKKIKKRYNISYAKLMEEI